VADPANEIRKDETSTAAIDMKLEVVIVPVADVDRAKNFYRGLGWRLDADVSDGDSRLVQLTPVGSGCSIQFGKNLFGNGATFAEPGSAQGLYLVVSDVEAARAELIAHGVAASDVFHCSSGYACRFPGKSGRISGPQPEPGSYGSFVSFNDPDGNGWLLQEVTKRLPGRVSGDTAFASAGDLSRALRRAEAAHAQHEARIGRPDPNWSDWYADYLVREQAGDQLPQ
jgi:catechol 2,3-dioxygenase-like lactoylglutathione lyase family enzyme